MKKISTILIIAVFVLSTGLSQSTTITSSNVLHFDGVNDYIRLGSMPPITSTYTIMAWIRPESVSLNTIGGWGHTSSSGNVASMLRINGGLLQTVQNNASIYGATSLTANTWVHVALTRNGNDFKIYVNGVLDGSGTENANTGSNVFTIGNMLYNSTDYFYFKGKMDEFALWNTELTAGSIESYMNSGMVGNETGLVMYHTFNQGVAYGSNTGITSVTDATVNGYDGTLYNFTLNGSTSNFVEWQQQSPTSSNVLHFDGVNDYIRLGSMPPITSTYTIMAWIRPESVSLNTIGGWGHTSSSGNVASMLRINGGLLQTVQNNASIYGATSLTANTWVHVALTRNGNDFKIYVNGVLDGSGTENANTGSNVFTIGNMLYNSTDYFYFKGKMDEFALWNTELTAGSIESYMNSGMVGNEAGLVMYHTFNQGIANGSNTGITSVTDATANLYNGTLYNFALIGSTSNFTVCQNQDQLITFDPIADMTYGDSDFDPGATASSGLDVTYSSSNTSVATIVSNQVHTAGAGTVTIYADQAGDREYFAAIQKSQLLTVTERPLEITADDGQSKIVGEEDPELTYTITSGSLVSGDAITGSLIREEGETPGAYNIELGTLSAGSDYTITFISADFIIEPATGINEHTPLSAKVYPNPTVDKIIITSNTPITEIVIINIQSQVIKEIKNIASERVEFNLGDLNSGSYIIRITDGNSTTSTMLVKE